LVNQDFSNSKFSVEFIDPRNPELGYRSYSEQEYSNSLELYNFKRISLKIPESEHDLTYEKSIISEFDFDNLNAIDYQKGCYVGQELTARTHYLGQIRKKIFHIKIADKDVVEKNSEITCEGKPAGIILSSVFFESELHALALIKVLEQQDFDNSKEKLELQNSKIFIIS
jgi:folate-binding protein YgfZ